MTLSMFLPDRVAVPRPAGMGRFLIQQIDVRARITGGANPSRAFLSAPGRRGRGRWGKRRTNGVSPPHPALSAPGRRGSDTASPAGVAAQGEGADGAAADGEGGLAHQVDRLRRKAAA